MGAENLLNLYRILIIHRMIEQNHRLKSHKIIHVIIPKIDLTTAGK